MKTIKNISFIVLSSLAVLACGGGGNDAPAPAPEPTGWVSGQFKASSQYKAKCVSPRSGTDIDGNAWPDRKGALLDENNWLRSWSHETYLWYNEITDRNPADYSKPTDYFDVLKTTATTASGNPKDQFHFYADTEEYQREASTGVSASYGARFRLLKSSPPRKIVVAYTEPNSPATNASLTRGAEVLKIDGVDAVNGGTQSDVNTLNAGLFPSSVGETHTFEIRDLGSNTTREITLKSAEVTKDPVQNEKIFNTATGKVGYMTFNTFGTRIAEQQLIDSFVNFSNQGVKDLVVDLRYNGGGFLFISSQLAYMVAGETRANGKTYNRTVYNDKTTAKDPTPFYNSTSSQATAPNGKLPSVNLNRVFVLSSRGTASASEAFINGLRGIDVEVILIGQATRGKPYGFLPTDNCGVTYFTIQFKGENNKGWGDFADGFIPSASDNGQDRVKGCVVDDDFTKQLGDQTEGMLAAALNYQATGACPAKSKLDADIYRYDWTQNPADLRNSEHYQRHKFFEDNRFDNDVEMK